MNNLSFLRDSLDEKKDHHLSPDVQEYSNECESCRLAESTVVKKRDFGESRWKACTGVS